MDTFHLFTHDGSSLKTDHGESCEGTCGSNAAVVSQQVVPREKDMKALHVTGPNMLQSMMGSADDTAHLPGGDKGERELRCRI